MSRKKNKSFGLKTFVTFILIMVALGVVFKEDVISFLDAALYYAIMSIFVFVIGYAVYRFIKKLEDDRKGF
jgi:hypothetical protein